MRLLFVACAVTIAYVVGSSVAHAQHLGSRTQWQPETMMADARLEQPVNIEILGRAAVPALELLSEATGVSLTVAPENLDTVGERKLTIISKGLSLKAIMVQLPEALQECHWDTDESREEPVYLLHQNAGVGEQQSRLRPRPGGRYGGAADYIDETREGAEMGRPGAPGLGEHRPGPEAPRDPALLAEVSLADVPDLTLPAVGRAIADQTGISVISDFFEDTSPCATRVYDRPKLALWRLLEKLAWKNGKRLLIWQKTGPCLTIYHSNWYALAQREMPEDIIRACRDKLNEQGGLTVHTLAETALALIDRGLTGRFFPADLRAAGLTGAVTADAWALVLYDSLSAEQKAQAGGEKGLPFAGLREDQQAWVTYRSRCVPDYLPVDQVGESYLHVAESRREVRGRSYLEVEIEVEFPAAADVAVLLLEVREQSDR